MHIDASFDDGSTWAVVATNVQNANATTGTYEWTNDGPVTRSACIRLRRALDAACRM